MSVKIFLSLILCAIIFLSVPSYANSPSDEISGYNQDMASLTFDNSKWYYDKDNDVYWQIKVPYCSKPVAPNYETMGIYVPGAYMTGVANGDGTYTCKINPKGMVNGYTAETAPIVFPVNTPGYSAQAAPTSYNYKNISSYIKAGFIYVQAGMRGRDNGYDSNGKLIYSGGAPWGVTDLKAAIRYYRYNKNVLPGNTDAIFTFGHSGGGAQSAIMGASGDSELYYPYLESISAAMYDKDGKYISDAIFGAMCWCPITSLDYADEAYEWNMGQYFSVDTRANTKFTSALSKDLAAAFATYINDLGLKDENNKVLKLTKSDIGIYTSGSYYDYLLKETETSLNNFLKDTKFPYTEISMPIGGGPNRQVPEGNPPTGQMLGDNPTTGQMPDIGQGNMAQASSKTYKTVEDYINSLNADEKWIIYDPKTNTAKITSIEAFVKHCKPATKSVGAFDGLNRDKTENKVFSNGKIDALHFDVVMANLLKANEKKYSAYSDWDPSYITAFANDLKEVDALGNASQYRQNMYNPMYFLSSYYSGYKTSKVAPHWRIRTGINQGDTALTVETNLALALRQYGNIDVDFDTVWGQGHTMAERTGNSTDNFIQWVNECVHK